MNGTMKNGGDEKEEKKKKNKSKPVPMTLEQFNQLETVQSKPHSSDGNDFFLFVWIYDLCVCNICCRIQLQ